MLAIAVESFGIMVWFEEYQKKVDIVRDGAELKTLWYWNKSQFCVRHACLHTHVCICIHTLQEDTT